MVEIKNIVIIERFLKESLDNNYIFYFYHDLETECVTLKDTIKGIRPDKTFSLKEITNLPV